MRRALFAALGCGMFLLPATGFSQDGGPTVEKLWARATPPQAKVGAVYLTVAGGSAADRLVGVASPVAGKAEIHEATSDNGVMKMRRVDGGLAVPAGKKVELKPGGYHVMLMGLKQQLKEGETVPLTLTFEKSGRREVEARIGKPGAMSAADGGMQGGGAVHQGTTHQGKSGN